MKWSSIAFGTLFILGCGGQGSRSQDIGASADDRLILPPNSIIYSPDRSSELPILRAVSLASKIDQGLGLSGISDIGKLWDIQKSESRYYFSTLNGSTGRWQILRNSKLTRSGSTVLLQGNGKMPSFVVTGQERKLVWTESVEPDKSSIRSKDLSTGTVETLHQGLTGTVQVYGSPNQQGFVYQQDSQGAESAVFLVPEQNSSKKLDQGAFIGSPTFSSDGRYLYYVKGDEVRREVFRADTVTREVRRITQSGRTKSSVVVDPLGTAIAFSVQGNGRSTIYFKYLAPAAPEELRLKDAAQDFQLQAWTPSGSENSTAFSYRIRLRRSE